MKNNYTNILSQNDCLGKVLKQAIKQRGYTQKQFAEILGMQPSHLSEIIRGKKPISVQFAKKLGEVFNDIPASFWIDVDEEARDNASISLSKYDNIININVLSKRLKLGKIPSVDKLNILHETFNLPDPDLFLERQDGLFSQGLFRKSSKTGLDRRMLSTWVVLARHEASKYKPQKKYKKELVEPFLIDELRTIFYENVNTIDRIKQAFNDYGIGFCIVEKVEHASIDGYSFLEDETPFIVVTKRYDRIDNLAFNVMHELGHVLYHLSIDNPHNISIENYDNESADEKAANKFAAESMIPQGLWELTPPVPMIPRIIQKKYTTWAEQYKINKWIVLGRIAFETGMYCFVSDVSRKIN